MPAPFTVTKHSAGDGVARLAVAGEVDLSVSGALRNLISNAITTDWIRELVVDLDQLTFLDSTGIAALVAGHKLAIEHGVAYRVANPRDRVRQVLEIAGVVKQLTGDDG
jgi:anti-sigma B factor antagonist